MTVANRSPASQAMIDAAACGRDLMGGTRAMRAAGKRWLPQFAGESEEAYRNRRDQSWLFNGYRKTVRDMTGRIFARPVEIEGGSGRLADWVGNIDNQGNDLSVFARGVCLDAMQAGVSYILVDAPRRDGTVTRAQAEAMNLRPYFSHLRAEDILGWRAESIDNVMTLTQLRIRETITAQDVENEFADVKIEQVRVLDRLQGSVLTRLFRKNERTGRWELVPEDAGGVFETAVPEITLAPVYLNRSAFMVGDPPLDDLADVNVAHWQSQSDQRNILHFARVPILHATGRHDDEGELVVAAGTATVSRDVNARLEWVEHSGAAIKAGRDDLKDLEFQMETFGLQLLVQRAQQSATGEVLDAKKETSQLAMFADALKDGLERAFQFMAMYAPEVGDVTVNVNDDFGASMMSAQEATVLLSAVNAGQMSRDTFLRELSRRGMLAPDIDVDEEAERIAAQEPEDLTGSPLDLTNGGE